MGERFHRPAVWTAAAVLGAAFGLLVLAHLDPAPVHAPFMAPGAEHLLGTDNAGRDLIALLALASVTSISIGVSAAVGATLIGALVGCAAGYWRSWSDDLLMRLTDIFLLIPTLPLVVVLAAFMGPGVGHVTLVITLTAWPATARVVRARVLSLREAPFVINARSMGAGDAYLIGHHILPNCAELLQAKASLAVAAAMLAEAGIGFLGLGDPIHPSWGSIIHDAFAAGALVNGYWWWVLPPMGLISLCVAGFNLAGGLFTYAEAAKADSGPGSWLAEVHPRNAATETDGETLVPPLLAVRGLSIRFAGSGHAGPVVDNLDLEIRSGEKIALIGATGSGKSLLLLAILGLLPLEAAYSGRILWAGEDIARWDPARRRRYRALMAAYVPQGVGAALNPVLAVARQVAERGRRHLGWDRRRADAEALACLQAAGLGRAVRYARGYPHHLSGGMKQRVLLAMALAGGPALLLADEPTKGLDPEAVAGVVGLFNSLEKEAVLAVTHDLDFAAAIGGRVAVMYAGKVMEDAPAADLQAAARHPYTQALLAARPARGLQPPPLVAQTIAAGPATGCCFRRCCPVADERCLPPPPLFHHRGHAVRCWRHAA